MHLEGPGCRPLVPAAMHGETSRRKMGKHQLIYCQASLHVRLVRAWLFAAAALTRTPCSCCVLPIVLRAHLDTRQPDLAIMFNQCRSYPLT